MTSTVRVTAHCHKLTKEVKVHLNQVEVATLQDGETQDFYVYDDREITVKEVLKDISGT